MKESPTTGNVKSRGILIHQPVLFIFGGLPAVGKTSVAKALARATGACHLRIDTLEQALIDTGACSAETIEAKGYQIAAALAKDNLRNGVSVIADCVNPVEEARQLWRDIAKEESCSVLEVEFICSDVSLHKQRAEHRMSDIPGLHLPQWEDIQNRTYELWYSDHLVLDTAYLSIEESISRIQNFICA